MGSTVIGRLTDKTRCQSPILLEHSDNIKERLMLSNSVFLKKSLLTGIEHASQLNTLWLWDNLSDVII